MLSFTRLAAALMLVAPLLAPTQATAADRARGPVTGPAVLYPYPGKLPVPGLIPVNPCAGVEQCLAAPVPILPPIALPGTPPSGPRTKPILCVPVGGGNEAC